MSLSITSTAFKTNEEIPIRFTCDGENISPELVIDGAPLETKSFALTLEDPDVPRNIRADGMWDHWIIWNIPPSTTHIEEGVTSLGVMGVGTGGDTKYEGPCPPDREHRYIFTLYALDTILSLQEGSTKKDLLHVLTPHILEKAEIIGRYDRE